MKRWIAAGALLLALPDPALADPGQTERGRIPIATPTERCGGNNIARHLDQRHGVRDIFEHAFAIEDGTQGWPFELSWTAPIDGVGADLDIAFLGPGEFLERFEARSPQMESGTVPSGAATGIVCMHLGAPVDFDYRAGSAVGSPDDPIQTVRGAVLTATGPEYVGPAYISSCGILEVMSRFATARRGWFADTFDVDPATNGRPFELTPRRPAAMYVAFLSQPLWTTAHVAPGIPAVPLPVPWPLVERGIVPPGAKSALVCIEAGPASGFTYVAG